MQQSDRLAHAVVSQLEAENTIQIHWCLAMQCVPLLMSAPLEVCQVAGSSSQQAAPQTA